MSAETPERDEVVETGLEEFRRTVRPKEGWEDRVWARIEARPRALRPARQLGWIVVVTATTLVLGGLGVYAYLDSQDKAQQAAVSESARARAVEEIHKLQAQINSELEAIMIVDDDTRRQLSALQKAGDAAERDRILANIATNRRAKDQAANKVRDLQSKKVTAKKALGPSCKDPNDPLCGI